MSSVSSVVLSTLVRIVSHNFGIRKLDIIEIATMPTTFKSVHLPPATIDSVRTIVSLPLLHPEAFSSGILKTHSMNGVLLFGPPGAVN